MESTPLPPPVEVPGVPLANSSDPFQLGPMFQSDLDGPPSAISSTSEPKPGEPLPPESEAMLAGEEGGPGGAADVSAPASDLVPTIAFSTAKTEKVLVEIFDWLAERFESDHWKLSDNQASMLGEPTAQLLGGVWTKLSEKLPDILTSTPGATAFLFACTVVVVPKAAQQVAVSRARRQGNSPAGPAKSARGPVPVQPRRPAPGDNFNSADVPMASGGDFMVPGD